MTVTLRARGVRVVLLDIEGTTTPMAFVHDVLFPFAREHLTDYLRDEWDSSEVREITAQLASEHAVDLAQGHEPSPWLERAEHERLASAVAYALWLMDRDRKSPALKRLQGRVWARGYGLGRLRGEIFSDVAPAIRRWREAGIRVAIYSSGSALAQRLLFESTPDGDLTPQLGGFFDTAVGPKTGSPSYTRIAHALDVPPRDILFISDAPAELAAARRAGLSVVLCVRPGNHDLPADGDAFDRVTTFDGL